MKKRFLYCLLAGVGLTLASCDESWDRGSDRQGRFNPIVELDRAPLGSKKQVTSRSGELTARHLSLELVTPTGEILKWNSIDDFDATAKFPVGNYTLNALYGDATAEGFETPYYYGSTNFTIRENESTPVSLTATLANAMVTVTYTEAFTSYFTEFSTDLVTSRGKTVTIADGELRQPYVTAGTVKVNANVTKPGGAKASYLAATFAAEARHHYHLTLDVNNGQVGNAQLVLTFDDSMENREVVIDLSDDLTNTPAPTLTAAGFDPTQPLTVVVGNKPAQATRLTAIAQGGLASVLLQTSCTSLVERGWPATVDLLGATAEQRSAMTALGFHEAGLWKNPAKMARIDLTDAIASIAYLTGGDNRATFTLQVTDRLGQQCDPVTLTVDIEQLVLDLECEESLMPEQTEIDLLLDYNGNNIDQVGVQYQNERGTWDNATVESAQAVSRSATRYRLHVTGLPAFSNHLVLRAVHTCGATSTQDVDVERVEPKHFIAVDPRDVFAHKALIAVTSSQDPVATITASSKLMMSTDGGETFSQYTFTVQGDNLLVQGLKENTSYTAKLIYDGITSARATFTTEAVPQIPNGNLDAATTTSGSGSNWECYVFNGWGTNNPMTTSQGANYAYCKISGTKPVDGYAGKGAALRTNGWGSGNSALSGVSGACKYIDPGMLHLGADRTARPEGYGDSHRGGPLTTADLNCGIAFTSRPTALQFMYKYTPKNSADHGEALVEVIDADGAVITSKVVNLGNAGDNYTSSTLTLDYPAKAAKAAKLYVRFLSTNVADALNKDSSWLNGPGWGNLSRGEYSGSTLYIDEVTLTY